MKKIYFFISSILLSIGSFAQDAPVEKKEPMVKFSGHARFELWTDTYESVAARDGDVYLYPKKENIDANGDDINAYLHTNMYSAQSRLRAKLNGPEAFGAKVNGMFEFDLLGLSADPEYTPRIRHLFTNLDWGKTQLLLGYTWHPVFTTECFPQVLAMGAALPFNPLSRAPQIKLTYKLSANLIAQGALITSNDFASKGPSNMQQNSGIPDIHGQLKYVTKPFAAGIVAGYRMYKPRLQTDIDDVKTTQTVGAYDVKAFLKVKATDDLTVKASVIYGQNLSSFVMIGGLGAAQDPNAIDDYTYSNLITQGTWAEIIYQLGPTQLGFFAGYSSILGSSEDSYYNLGYTRSGDIDNIVRLAPRISYTSGRVMIGFEYMYNAATYIDLDPNGDKWEATKTYDPTVNHRFHFSTKYTF